MTLGGYLSMAGACGMGYRDAMMLEIAVVYEMVEMRFGQHNKGKRGAR